MILSVACDKRWTKLTILGLENPKWMFKYLPRVALGVILKYQPVNDEYSLQLL